MCSIGIHADGIRGSRICLIFRTISKNRCSWITKRDIDMFHKQSWKFIHFGVKRSKDQGHESQQVCVGLQTDRNIAAGCVRKPRLVFLLQCPAAQAILATPDLPCVVSPRPRNINHARQTDRWSFSIVCVFCSHGTNRQTDRRTYGRTDARPLHIRYLLNAEIGKNIANGGCFTLMSACFF